MFSNLKNNQPDSSKENSMQQRIAILASVDIFTELKENVLKQIAKSLKRVKVPGGNYIFKKGDLQRALYIIEDGLVKIHIEEHIFATFSNNQIFGEYSLIDSSERSASVTAIKDTSLLVLDQETFKKISLKNPEITDGVLKSLTHRLRKYNEFEKLIIQQKGEIEKQREELLNLNHTKDRFFSIIAHDLKNPFSTVVNLSEVLALEYENFDNEKRVEFVDLIHQYSKNTFNLLENLLQWASIQTGRLKKQVKEINMHFLVSENIDLLKGNAENKNIQLINDLSENIVVFADVQMITTVIRNLLSNAIKFTPPGGTVQVYGNTNSQKAELIVEDNGIGIAEKDIDKLFKIDSNPTTIGTSEEKGTGLGLILCKEFIELNNGEIYVESIPGKGSRFIFSLPLKNDNE